MLDTALNAQETAWLALTQPVHGHTDNPRYLKLLSALDEGWEMAPPVYRRPGWFIDCDYVYHFILKHPNRTGTRLINVPEDEIVQRFVRENRLEIL